MRVTFLHPDLGIGGAERLIVDAAVALQNKGHAVKMVTAQYDSFHSFKETEKLDISVIKLFPRDLYGHCFALCAYIRMCLAALYICICFKSDVIVTDQVSASLLVFRLFSSARLVFYCHHPDMLLTDRKTALKSFYRYFLDSLEEKTTSLADCICVNSLYTGTIVKKTFRSINPDLLTVLYPTLNTQFFDDIEDVLLEEIPPKYDFVFVSLNRFEMKKNIGLALRAFASLRNKLSADVFSRCFLVVAGGYDKHNQENLVYHRQLREDAIDLEIPQKQVTFVRSPSDAVKVSLLRRATAVLYTPTNEHFGIVPVEAMHLGIPVIATNSGGPKESIADNLTGFLLEPEPDQWAEIMARLVMEPELRSRAAEAGPERVQKLFAFESFSNRLDKIIKGEPLE